MTNEMQNKIKMVLMIVILLTAAFMVFKFVQIMRQTEPEVEVISEPILSEDEVAELRYQLPVETNNLASSTIIEVEDTGESTYIPLEEIPVVVETPPIVVVTPVVETTPPPTSETVETTEESPGTEVALSEGVTIESTGGGIKINSVTVTNMSQTGAPQQITRSGIVRIIDTNQNIFVIGEGEDVYRIIVDSKTKFIIDGNRMNFNALQEDDIVEVTGMGYTESTELEADTVTVTGTYMLERPPAGV